MRLGSPGTIVAVALVLVAVSACTGVETTSTTATSTTEPEGSEPIAEPESDATLPPAGDLGSIPTVVEGTDDHVDVTEQSTDANLPEETTTTTSTSTTTTSTTTTTIPTTTTTVEPCQPPIPSDVLFDTDSAELREEADDQLSAAAETLLEDCPASRIVVVGHTDSRGTEEYNLDLSLRRAEAVIEWMVEFGIDRSIFEADGAGESELLEPDVRSDGTFDQEVGARNRRVEFIVHP